MLEATHTSSPSSIIALDAGNACITFVMSHSTYDHLLRLLLFPGIEALPTILLKFPVSVVERAYLTSLEPPGDAVEVEGVLFVEPSLADVRLVAVKQLTLQMPQATVHSSFVAEA